MIKKTYQTILQTVLLCFVAYSCTQSLSESAERPEQTMEEEEESGFFNTISKKIASVGSMNAVEYVAWVENPKNGLVKTQTLGKFKYSLQYKPVDYQIVKDVASTDFLYAKDYDSLSKIYQGFEYYTLSIEDTTSLDEVLKSDLKYRTEYDERISYFSFQIQKDIQLVCGNDTLPCTMAHFERTFNIAPKANFMLAFPLSEKAKQALPRTLMYEDKIFNTGIVKLKIQAQDLADIPKIKVSTK